MSSIEVELIDGPYDGARFCIAECPPPVLIMGPVEAPAVMQHIGTGEPGELEPLRVERYLLEVKPGNEGSEWRYRWVGEQL